MEKATQQIGIRVSEEFKKRIETQAKKEKRTMSNLIVKVMTEYLEQVEEHK